MDALSLSLGCGGVCGRWLAFFVGVYGTCFLLAFVRFYPALLSSLLRGYLLSSLVGVALSLSLSLLASLLTLWAITFGALSRSSS